MEVGQDRKQEDEESHGRDGLLMLFFLYKFEVATIPYFLLLSLR